MMPAAIFLVAASLGADPIGPGDHTRRLTVDGRDRNYCHWAL